MKCIKQNIIMQRFTFHTYIKMGRRRPTRQHAGLDCSTAPCIIRLHGGIISNCRGDDVVHPHILVNILPFRKLHAVHEYYASDVC